MTTVKEHIEWLQKTYKPTDVLAVAMWTVDDVLEKAKEKGMKITREQANEVLHRIDRRQDASIGINWDTIDTYLDDLED